MALTGKKKLIILDRDGVINAPRDTPINHVDDWHPLPGSMDAIALLTQSDYTIVVASNISGIGRGLISMKALNEVHSKMHQLVQQAGGHISGIWFCPHTAAANCDCRKPKPGMITDILDRLNIKAQDTWLVGDGLRDMQAIAAAGGHPALVLTGKGKQTLATETLPEDTQIFANLLDFAKYCVKISPDKTNNTKEN